MPLTVGFAIPAYAGAETLQKCLESISRCVPGSRNTVVVDDSGTGKITKLLRDKFPDIQWIIHAQNLGFGLSANEAVQANPDDIVVLLNDDVELLSDPVASLRAAFQDDGLFAVTFRSLDSKDKFREGAKRLVWRFGFPRVLHNEKDQMPAENGVLMSSYAVGGHAAFRRSKFLDLGGFDPLFDPFYWEDVDLSQRALQRGWKSIYLPDCMVRHAGPSAIRSRNNEKTIREMTLRNRLLFAWRHAGAAQKILLSLGLSWEKFRARITGDRAWLSAYSMARVRQSSVREASAKSGRLSMPTASIDR
jgi:GT2 family glycosyltransferase